MNLENGIKWLFLEKLISDVCNCRYLGTNTCLLEMQKVENTATLTDNCVAELLVGSDFS